MHLERISRMCERLGLELGMTATEAETLRNASLLHDVGQDRRPRRDPAAAQRALATRTASRCACHTTVGAELLSGSSSEVMRMAEEIARTHHERWDGEGYPAGLAGEAIPLVGRICAVCDVFDALLSDRPYKEPWPLPEALAQLRRERGTHFDPAVVDAFLRIVDDLDPDAAGARPSSRRRHPRQAIGQRLEQQLLGRVEDQQRAGLVDVLDGARAARCGPRPSASSRSASRRSAAWTTSGAPSATHGHVAEPQPGELQRLVQRARRARGAAARLAASAPSRSARLRSRVGR